MPPPETDDPYADILARKTFSRDAGRLKIFSGSSNPDLAAKIAFAVGGKTRRSGGGVLNSIYNDRFPDGEIKIHIGEDVRGSDCFIIQSLSSPVNDNLVELLVTIDALKRSSAARITAVVPYLAYARQDRKSEGRTPITSRMVANILQVAGIDRILTMDLHAQQIEGFFDVPVDHLRGKSVFIKHFKKKFKSAVVVSPDMGNAKVASSLANQLDWTVAFIHKERIDGDNAVAKHMIGDVKDKDVIMLDDMIATAGTVCAAAELVKEHGAKNVYVAATHGLFVGPAAKRIMDSPITSIFVTDTIPPESVEKEIKKVEILSVSDMFADAIYRIHNNLSVSEMFKG